MTFPALLLSSKVLASPAAVSAALKVQAASSSHPVPTLSVGDLQRLDAGEVVRLRTPSAEGGAIGALGLLITDLSAKDLWMGTLDPHGRLPSDIRMHALPGVGDELYRWYGFVDLPAPLKDRHFLVRTTIDTPMAARSQGSIWERSWGLEKGWPQAMRPLIDSGQIADMDVEHFDDAIPTPVNQGTWTVLDLRDGRSLLAYQVATALGGDLPDGPLNRYLYWTLNDVLTGVVNTARTMSQHYVTGHDPLIGGDGKAIATY